ERYAPEGDNVGRFSRKYYRFKNEYGDNQDEAKNTEGPGAQHERLSLRLAAPQYPLAWGELRVQVGTPVTSDRHFSQCAFRAPSASSSIRARMSSRTCRKTASC